MTTLIELTRQIVASYVDGNLLEPAALPALIKSVHGTLSTIDSPVEPEAEPHAKATNAQIRKSLANPARIVSFIDGRSYQLLKRHLTVHGFTPETYREQFGLPTDYPMTARDYSDRRSTLARAAGLGQAASLKKLVKRATT